MNKVSDTDATAALNPRRRDAFLDAKYRERMASALKRRIGSEEDLLVRDFLAAGRVFGISTSSQVSSSDSMSIQNANAKKITVTV